MAYQPLQPETRSFLRFLSTHPEIRVQIKAPPDKTVLYTGEFAGPMWATVKRDQQFAPAMHDKVTLEDVLVHVAVPGAGYANLMEYANGVAQALSGKASLTKAEADRNINIIWKALSGIFASQAVGRVSFHIGSNVDPKKVFASTELAVLARNKHVSPLTKELIGYYQDCIRKGITAINLGFTAG